MSRSLWKRGTGAAAAVALVAVGAVAVTSSAAGPKTYTATQGAVIYSGKEQSASIVIKNTSTNKISFSAINVTVPAGLTPQTGATPTQTFDFTPAATPTAPVLVGSTIQLRDLDVPRGKSVTVALAVRVPCSGGPFVWNTDVRQSNNFLGTDNKFLPENGSPNPGDVSMTRTGTCKLSFTGQPATADLNATITQVARTPSSTSLVEVKALDGNNDVMTWWTNAIALSSPAVAGTSGGPGTVTGTAAFAQSAGVATFKPSIDTVGRGYQLVATSTGATSATSNAFDIGRFSASITCTAGDKVTCETGNINGPTGGVANVVLDDSDSVTGTLTASYVVAAFSCASRGYTPSSDQLLFDVQNTTGDLSTLKKTVTFTKPLGSGSTVESDYQVCFAAPYKFPALDLTAGALQADFTNYDFSDNTDPISDIGNGVSGYKGLLLPCSYNITPNASKGETAFPCVVSRSVDTINSVVTVVVRVPAADPGVRF